MSGTPTAGGTFSFTAEVTDSIGFKVSKVYTLTITAPVISLAPSSLPKGSQGLAYDQAVSATGGKGPYRFAITSGALPPGLLLDTDTGKISGTPKTNGHFTFSVTATDVNGFKGNKAFALVIDGTYIAKHTAEVIQNFTSHRADVLTSNEPDRARQFRRLGKSLLGPDTEESADAGSSGGAPISLGMSGSEDGGSARIAFATGLQQMFASRRKDQAGSGDVQTDGKMTLGGPVSGNTASTINKNFDFWVEAHAVKFDAKGSDSTGDVGLVYTGADYLVMPGLLVGAILQFDQMDEKSVRLNSDVSGHGWMAGPYVAARLLPNLYFDGRIEWGESTNTVKPFNTFADKFTTDRWLVRADLTGNWEWDHFRFTPSAGITYFEDDQKAYVDSNGIAIAGHTATLGRVTFGPEFGYRFKLEDGTTAEPFVSIQGLWDFEKQGAPIVAGSIGSGSDLRAKVQGGVSFVAPSGYTLRASGGVDGLGDDKFEAYSGQLWINMPLN